MVPMSGLDRSGSIPENVLKIAYERLPRFSVYKSLRQFKDKFDPVWETTYVAFDSQLDMMNLPLALREVVRAS
jgi:phosphatidylglycerol lysyltransferase